MTVSIKQNIFNKGSNKIDVVQNCSLDKMECAAYNQIFKDGTCKIEINLSNLMSRKNMALKNVVRRIDYYFLLELTCAILQEQNLWKRKLCSKSSSGCNIQKMFAKMATLR